MESSNEFGEPFSKQSLLIPRSDPILGEVRAFSRYLIRSASRQRKSFVRRIMERDLILTPSATSTLADETHVNHLKSPGRWQLILRLQMDKTLYRHQMTDHRGDMKVVHFDNMSSMPGYFADYRNIAAYRKFNQNSEEMAAFYVLRYGDVRRAELRGSQEFFEADMTLVKMVLGEEIGNLEKDNT